MAISISISLRCFFLCFFLHLSTSRVYIVYFGASSGDPLLTSQYHIQILNTVFDSKVEATQSMLYTYKHAFSGFAAILNATQAAVLEHTKGVISVFESQLLQLHTTRSWDFMGLTLDPSHGSSTPLQLAYGDDIIVGHIDTGVWPESASFMEEPNMGPIPKSWKGRCVAGEDFNPEKACNKKLIGAQYYLKGYEASHGNIKRTYPEYRSPRDFLGHGTKTASILVGSRSVNASAFSFAPGIARGGAPRARLAVYKACWQLTETSSECNSVDILAAFDDALHDGVHVISAAFGARPPLKQFFASATDIASFHAMQLGVSVIFPAGNDGPDPSLVRNVNPWSISVAASTVDRSFPTKILLGDGTVFVGEGLINNITSGVLESAQGYFSDGICTRDNWNKISALGKVLICFYDEGVFDHFHAEYAAYWIDATALIYVQPLNVPIDSPSVIPVVYVDTIQGSKLYRKSFSSTKVQILPSETAFGRSPAPIVSRYSSRGPSSISPDILKPDITAPGTNILTAWKPNASLSEYFLFDRRHTDWSFDSGTSISCPHVAGVAALIKSAHPHWSPAAIRSALMTTAYNRDINGDGILVERSTKSSDPFDIGAGHMNPVKAFNPGLIYNITTSDYVTYLCNYGYSDEQIKAIVMKCDPTTCPKCSDHKVEPNWSLNYPSISVPNLNRTTTVKRTVLNVGPTKRAMYFVSIESPNGVGVTVSPRVLTFSSLNEEKSYYVTLTPLKASEGRYDFGSITWCDGFHQVRSPLVVKV